jgi:hypothetical protein
MFPRGQLGNVPIYLPLPGEVLRHIGVCHHRQEVVKGFINAQVALRARSWDPHTSRGWSNPVWCTRRWDINS